MAFVNEHAAWDPFWTAHPPEPEPVFTGPPTGTSKEVLAWVDGDSDRASEALEAELAAGNRVTLIAELRKIIT